MKINGVFLLFWCERYNYSAFGLFSAHGICSILGCHPQGALFDYTQGKSTKCLQKIMPRAQTHSILKMLVWVLGHSLIHFHPTN